MATLFTITEFLPIFIKYMLCVTPDLLISQIIRVFIRL